MPTRTQQRPAGGTGRFARSQPSQSGRFARAQASRPRRSPGGTSTARLPMRSASKKQQSGPMQLVKSLTGGSGKGRSAPGMGKGRSAGAGGIAALAGLAGLAFKNRDKLTSKLGRGGGQTQEPHSVR